MQLNRKAVYEGLELGGFAGPRAAIFEFFMVALISLNVIAVVLETVPLIETRFATFFTVFELFSVAVFSIEYIFRLWVSVEHWPELGDRPWRARLRYALTPLAIVDLLAILPFFLFAAGDWRALRLVRLVRLLKLIRYSAALVTLMRVMFEERRALLAALVIMVCSLFFASTVMYMIERHAQPEDFGTIPDALWWALATLTTVGYGDVVPITPLGKIAGGLMMIFGLALYALPVGIMASGFSQEIRRRQFLVPVGLLKKIQVFEGLDELSLTDIASRMRTIAIPNGNVVVHRRDRGGGLFLIISGTAHAVCDGSHIPLSEGDFFGEVAFVTDLGNQPAIYSHSRLRLLHLESSDLEIVLTLYPEIRHNLLRLAQSRLDNLERLGQLAEDVRQELEDELNRRLA